MHHRNVAMLRFKRNSLWCCAFNEQLFYDLLLLSAIKLKVAVRIAKLLDVSSINCAWPMPCKKLTKIAKITILLICRNRMNPFRGRSLIEHSLARIDHLPDVVKNRFYIYIFLIRNVFLSRIRTPKYRKF